MKLRQALDAGFDLNDQQLDKLLDDSDSLQESTENVLQKNNLNNV